MGTSETSNVVGVLKDAGQKGEWLLLKNLHLVPAFLPLLLKEIQELQPSASFRLWLTTETMDSIPPVLLEAALKCVYEGM